MFIKNPGCLLSLFFKLLNFSNWHGVSITWHCISYETQTDMWLILQICQHVPHVLANSDPSRHNSQSSDPVSRWAWVPIWQPVQPLCLWNCGHLRAPAKHRPWVLQPVLAAPMTSGQGRPFLSYFLLVSCHFTSWYVFPFHLENKSTICSCN